MSRSRMPGSGIRKSIGSGGRHSSASSAFAGESAAWIVLLFGICLSLAGWYVSRGSEDEAERLRFHAESDRIAATIQSRMANYEQVLIDGAALFSSSVDVTRTEWADFIRTSDLFNRFPGAQANGFAAWVPDGQRAAHVARLRAEGFSDYDIRPPGRRDVYVPIVYNEPFEGRNRRVIGFDMYSEPIRRAAMDRAVATGKAAISGMVVLAGESADDRPPGFVLYAPIWRRRAQGDSGDPGTFIGFAFAPFRVGDLMDRMPHTWDKAVAFSVFDGNSAEELALMYDSAPGQAAADPAMTRRIHTSVMGQPWTIETRVLSGFHRGFERSVPGLTLVTGFVLSLLLFALTRALRHTQVSEERFRDYAELGSDWLWELDRNFRFIYLSRPRLPPLGIDAAKVLGQTWREAFGSFSASADDDFLSRIEATMQAASEFQHLEWCARLPVGGFCWLRISGRPIFDKQGELLGYRGGCADNSGNRNLADQLVEARQQVETAGRARSQFLAMTSHELRTPLNAIIGFAEVIEQRLFQAPDDPRYVEYARGIAESGRHLLYLFSELLEMSRVDEEGAGGSGLHVDLVELAQTAAEALGKRASRQGVELRVVDANVPRVRVDGRAMRQVFINLISNAIKFTPDGGRVSIEFSLEADGAVRIEVRDTGIGMSAETVNEVLDPAFDGQKISDTLNPTRLGLPISRSLVEVHGGTLTLESSPGQGTRAIIRLPPSRVIR